MQQVILIISNLLKGFTDNCNWLQELSVYISFKFRLSRSRGRIPNIYLATVKTKALWNMFLSLLDLFQFLDDEQEHWRKVQRNNTMQPAAVLIHHLRKHKFLFFYMTLLHSCTLILAWVSKDLKTSYFHFYVFAVFFRHWNLTQHSRSFKCNQSVLVRGRAKMYTLALRNMPTCFHKVSSFSGNWTACQAPHTLPKCSERPRGTLTVMWGDSFKSSEITTVPASSSTLNANFLR